MKVTFRLRYHTRPGQTLRLTGRLAPLGNGAIENAVALHYRDAESWQAAVQLDRAAVPKEGSVYNYLLVEPDGSVVQDWGEDRRISPAWFRHDEVLVIDAWNPPGAIENAFYTEPFQEVLLRRNHTEIRSAPPANVTHTFQVKAPLLGKGQTLCLVGDAPALGQWQTGKAVRLNRAAGENFLSVSLDLSGQPFPIHYKYG
ncbi:MAG TPA: carbohydrate-binding module family 20 domain-containing protein, partial [Candidatus Acidoferrum sp.]|nr:carbohydrate-binding module family 20 domain-containing protein [Candidatus Acidoferrum sp.]